MNRIIFIVFFLIICFPLFSQEITGKVIDNHTQDPVINARITDNETKESTTTDKNGFFSIIAGSGSILVIEHPFYRKVEIEALNASEVFLISAVINLEEIVLKADPMKDIIHSFIIMDNIKKGSQPRNSADLFNDIPGFSILKRSAMASEPLLRSFRYEQLNIKFDGCTKIVNACPNRMDPITSHIIPEEVSKIEVIKGPYTVRFGQTFGGIVNMITKQPIPDEFGIHGNAEAGYELNGENKVARAEIMYAKKRFDITANGEYRDFGDYQDGNGLVVPSGFNTVSYSLKAGVNPSSNQRLQVDWRQKFGTDILHAGLPMDSPKDDSYSAAIDYRINNISRLLNSLTFKSYYSRVDHLMDNHLRPNYVKMDAATPVISNTLGGKLEFGLQPLKSLFVFAGFDLNNEKRDGERTRIIKLKPDGTPFPDASRPVKIDSVWQDSEIRDLGFFAEATYRVSGKLFATAGIRSDLVSAQANSPATGFSKIYESGFNETAENTVGGNISAKYQNNGTLVQLAYGLGTRSASMLERYIYHLAIGADGYEYVGNPFLKPEKNNQIELSVSHQNERLNVGASVFYSAIKDFISAVYKEGDEDFKKVYDNPFPYAKQFINVDAEQIGFEAFFDIRLLDGLEFNSNIGYTKADNKTFDEPLAQIAPLTTRFGLKYEKSKFWIDLRTTLSADQGRLASSFGEKTITPGYTTADIRVGYKPLRGISLGVAILNVFDESYYNHMNYTYSNTIAELVGKKIYEPGRNISFYARYQL